MRDAPDKSPDDATNPVPFGRLIHLGSKGRLTLTTIAKRADGTDGVPYTRAFDRKRDWWLALSDISDAVQAHFCFSTFTDEICKNGSSKGMSNANLRDLTAAYLDLDWHKHSVASTKYRDIHEVLAEVDRRCDAAGFPRPTGVLSSGRGLLVAWNFKATPAYWRHGFGFGPIDREGSLVRWNLLQRWLFELFSDLGADPAALPACHWFKLPGTVNHKSGLVVRVIRSYEPKDRLCFSSLMRLLPARLQAELKPSSKVVRLPTAKRVPASMPAGDVGEVLDFEIQRAMRRGTSSASRASAVSDDIAKLIWAPRLRSLVALAEHRAAGGRLPDGQRDCLLFVVAIAMAWISRTGWVEEYIALARRLTPWSDGECLKRVSAVVKRAGQPQGQDSGLYTLHTETIRRFVGLTDEEERMDFASAIAREGIAKATYEKRRVAKRRHDGVKTMSDYSDDRAAALSRQVTESHQLHNAGLSNTEIASRMGCNERSVRRYLSMKPEVGGTDLQAQTA